MQSIRTIWQLQRRTGWIAALLVGEVLTSWSAQGQARGRQAVPTTPTVAPTGQPAYRNVIRTGVVVTNDNVTDLGPTPLN